MANWNKNPMELPNLNKNPMELANGNNNPNVIGQLKPIPQFNDKNEIILII